MVEPFGGVNRSQYRTYRFTWRVIAVLTQHGLVHYRNVLQIIQTVDIILLGVRFPTLLDGVITVDAQPMHFAATAHLITAYNRNVVFDVTSYNTGSTSRTSVQVDGHYPFVAGLLVLIPQVISLMRVGPPSGIMARILLVFCEGRFPDYVAAFNGVVCLGLGRFIFTTGLAELAPTADGQA